MFILPDKSCKTASYHDDKKNNTFKEKELYFFKTTSHSSRPAPSFMANHHLNGMCLNIGLDWIAIKEILNLRLQKSTPASNTSNSLFESTEITSMDCIQQTVLHTSKLKGAYLSYIKQGDPKKYIMRNFSSNLFKMSDVTNLKQSWHRKGGACFSTFVHS